MPRDKEPPRPRADAGKGAKNRPQDFKRVREKYENIFGKRKPAWQKTAEETDQNGESATAQSD
jgi:hypothetical protein